MLPSVHRLPAHATRIASALSYPHQGTIELDVAKKIARPGRIDRLACRLTDILGFVVLPIVYVYVLSRRLQIQPRDYGFVSLQKGGASALNLITPAWATGHKD